MFDQEDLYSAVSDAGDSALCLCPYSSHRERASPVNSRLPSSSCIMNFSDGSVTMVRPGAGVRSPRQQKWPFGTASPRPLFVFA